MFHGDKTFISLLREEGYQRARRLLLDARARRNPATVVIAGGLQARRGALYTALIPEDSARAGAHVIGVIGETNPQVVFRELARRLHRALP